MKKNIFIIISIFILVLLVIKLNNKIFVQNEKVNSISNVKEATSSNINLEIFDEEKIVNEKIFLLDEIDSRIKYKFENLEKIYLCERYIENYNNDLEEEFYENNKDYIEKIYENAKIFGNFNFALIKNYDFLNDKYVFDLPKLNTKMNDNLKNNFNYKDIDTLFICSKYDISEFSNTANCINTYEKLIEKIESENENIKIYICSFLPIKDDANDIFNKKEVYNIYNRDLKEYFNDKYVDISFLAKRTMYDENAILKREKFYKSLMTFLALYKQCNEMKNDKYEQKEYSLQNTCENTNKVFLTFDDGPGNYINVLLNILDKYDCKVTFFVVGEPYTAKKYINLVHSRGHTVGAHAFKHDYAIYRNVDTYLEDLYKIQKIIKDATGEFTNIIRFPGGSSNTSSVKYCEGVMTELVQVVQNMGYKYYDWNVSSGDGNGGINSERTLQLALNGILLNKGFKDSIVLFHDTKSSTIAIVDKFCKLCKEYNLEFGNLKESDIICHHSVAN